ncbi:hypothetical protein FACS189421_13720 [Bacteroidia bacterium]|nr:hypothetical protein FACS189421_13720 [Bacteroidia bacterium]GHT46970.1 hypothetical protein FACS189440_06180 [Bacteroidia bacterium]
MYLKFTQEKHEEHCNVLDEEISFHSMNPRKATLAFILQFAYAYHVEKELPVRMSEMILN